MVTRMQQRRGTASQWTAANTILADGEIGFETDTSKFKIGDGSTAWNSLPYFVNADDIETGLLDTDEVSEGTTNLYFTNQRAIDAVGENLALDDLSDVATSGVADGDALVYNTATTSWVPGSVAIDSLNDIADVNITTPANGEVLAYSDGDWVNQEASGGGIKDITTSTTGFTFSLEDAGDLIQIDSSSETTITIPSNDSVPIPVKTQVNIVRAGTGDVVIESEKETVILEEATVSWTTQTSNFGNTAIYSIAYANNLWVAGGWAGQIRTSTNAITWVTQTSNFEDAFIFSIAFGDNLWVAGGFSGQLRTSTNAINWTTQTSNFGNTIIRSIAYGDNLWVAGGFSGQLRTSTDAITWVTQTSNFGNTNIFSITYGNNLWVAGGYSGQIRTSTNAITWTTQNSNFGIFAIRSISYGDNLWVAGGDLGQLSTSTNAIAWITQTSNFANIQNIQSIAYGDNLWVAGGAYGQLRTSTNAITWVTRTSNFGSNILSIAYGDNLWVAGEVSGQLRTSQNVFDNIDFVTLNSSSGLKLRDQWSVATAIKTGTDEWLITGDLSE